MKAGKGAAAPEGAADGGDSADFRCLVRATDGKRKFSTAVRARAAPCAFAALAQPQRAHVVLGLNACSRRLQLSAKQVARFHASYTIMQKARAALRRQRRVPPVAAAAHATRQCAVCVTRSRCRAALYRRRTWTR
jgi:hypothetical protein